ncbi:MAG: winged helix-turn-helix transcriptional regulator [Solirubrobacterales bacterium]
MPGDAGGYRRRPDGAFPYGTSPLLVEPEKATPSAVARALEVAGIRWNLSIIRELERGVHRFNGLRDSLGISGKMLMRRLHMLLAYGIVERVPCPKRANASEYRLTDSGRELAMIVGALERWAVRRLAPELPTKAADRFAAWDDSR